MNGRIDSHQHFWRLDRGDYGWLTPELGPIYRDFLPADLAPHLAAADVAATILVQAAPTVDETRFMLSLAHQHDFIAGVVGWVDFESPTAPDTIAQLADDVNLVGLRPMIQGIPETDWMLREELTPAFEAMIGHGLVFDALVLPRHLSALRELTARHPDLDIVLDHGAKPPIATGNIADWKLGIAALARESRMACKLSGLVTEAMSVDPALLSASVEHLLEHFGPRRLMWGSDWPVCEYVCSYAEWSLGTERLLANLRPDERRSIYSDTARETYGI